MRPAYLFCALLLCVTHGIASDAAQELTPEGVWLSSNKRIHVEIAPCGDRLCGKVVWLKNPNDEAGDPRSDHKNPDRGQRRRPVMGMTVIQGLVRSEPDVWTDGTIYNPNDGETYSARVTVVDPDTLHVRAYKFLPLFGETQIWTRIQD